MKIFNSLCLMAIAMASLASAAVESASADVTTTLVRRAPQVCSDGKSYCDGCQCCPDGYLCPNAPTTGSCPNSTCPKGRAGSNNNNNNGGSGSGSTSTTATGTVCTVTSTVVVTTTVVQTNTSGNQPTSTAPTTTPTTTTQPTSSGSASSSSHRVTVINKCPYTVWPGLLGSTIVNNGGWTLTPGQTSSVTLPVGWSGRIWGRTGCNFDANGRGFCDSGDCGGVLQCNGAGGNPPATLAEITFNAHEGLDFYDVSLVDGYNVPMTFTPVSGTYSGTPSGYTCTAPGCISDLNAICPAELQKVVNGKVVACMSACEKFNTDQYCCRNAFGTPATCKNSQWPTDYPSIFKKACPTAYSYAYDDTTSTFTCTGQPQVDYQVTFCN